MRGKALETLARLAAMPTPRRDLVELRTEAVASLGEFDTVEVGRLEATREGVWALHFSPDSGTLATAPFGGGVQLWKVSPPRFERTIADPAAQRRERLYPAPAEPRPTVKFLADGCLAYAAWDHRIAFLDASGRASLRTPLAGGSGQVVALAVDRSGKWIAVGWHDGRIELYQLADGALRLALRGNPHALALSADGRRFAAVVSGGTLVVHWTDQGGRSINVARPRESVRRASPSAPTERSSAAKRVTPRHSGASMRAGSRSSCADTGTT